MNPGARPGARLAAAGRPRCVYMAGENSSQAGLVAERRRQVRNSLVAAAILASLACVATALVMLLLVSGRGNRVPDVRGMTYEKARNRVESSGFTMEIDPGQDSSGDCDGLEVESQDPKPGTEAGRDKVVTVRLKGLHESPELVRELAGGAPGGKRGSGAPEAQEGDQPGREDLPRRQPAGHTVCLDPGHSIRTGDELDPATGLNVGDNTGSAGEVRAMWELAQKTRARLEQAGYTVRLTKESPDSYASLRSRADTGNTCEIVIRLHYDDSGFTGVMRPPANAARCPVSDPSRITVVSPAVASGSDRLAACLAAELGLQARADTGGTSKGNGTPAGHPTALIGSVLSAVPVVCIENRVSLVKENPGGQEEVAERILRGVNAYFTR